MKGGGNLQG